MGAGGVIAIARGRAEPLGTTGNPSNPAMVKATNRPIGCHQKLANMGFLEQRHEKHAAEEYQRELGAWESDNETLQHCLGLVRRVPGPADGMIDYSPEHAVLLHFVVALCLASYQGHLPDLEASTRAQFSEHEALKPGVPALDGASPPPASP